MWYVCRHPCTHITHAQQTYARPPTPSNPQHHACIHACIQLGLLACSAHTPCRPCAPQTQLEAAREAANAPPPGSAGDPAMQRMHAQLMEAQKRASTLDEELHRTRAALQKLKNAERSVVHGGRAGGDDPQQASSHAASPSSILI